MKDVDDGGGCTVSETLARGKLMRRILQFVLLGFGTMLAAAPASQATQILVGQCIEFATCWSAGTPTAWSDSLSVSDLNFLVGNYSAFDRGAESNPSFGWALPQSILPHSVAPTS